MIYWNFYFRTCTWDNGRNDIIMYLVLQMSAINLSLTGYKINAQIYSNKLYFVRIRLALHHILEIDIYMCVPYKPWFYF